MVAVLESPALCAVSIPNSSRIFTHANKQIPFICIFNTEKCTFPIDFQFIFLIYFAVLEPSPFPARSRRHLIPSIAHLWMYSLLLLYTSIRMQVMREKKIISIEYLLEREKNLIFFAFSFSCPVILSHHSVVFVLFSSFVFYQTRVCIASKCLWFTIKAVFTVEHHQNSAQKFRVTLFCAPICAMILSCMCVCVFFCPIGGDVAAAVMMLLWVFKRELSVLLLLHLVRCSVN